MSYEATPEMGWEPTTVLPEHTWEPFANFLGETKTGQAGNTPSFGENTHISSLYLLICRLLQHAQGPTSAEF